MSNNTLTPSKLAKLTGISYQVIFKAINNGDLPSEQTDGHHHDVLVTDAIRWIEDFQIVKGYREIYKLKTGKTPKGE